MIRWAFVAFVISLLGTALAWVGHGREAQLGLDVAIAAFLFGLIDMVVSWVDREELAEENRHRFSH